jgi:hypothetical protein
MLTPAAISVFAPTVLLLPAIVNAELEMFAAR